MKKLLIALVACGLVACKGDAGPTGPAGPAGQTGAMGPAGPQGSPGLDGASAVISFGIQVIDGTGVATLIAENAQAETAVINCYTSDSVIGPWLVVADASGGTSSFCGVSNIGTDFVVILVDGIPGWFFMATMVTVS